MQIEPAPWVEAYLGTPWVQGQYECWHFVTTVLEERFGHQGLPLVVAGNDPRAARRLFSDHPERAEWTPTDDPREGDVVLMRQGALPCHVGLFVAPSHILHAIKGAGGILTHTNRLDDLGYRVAGVYRKAP